MGGSAGREPTATTAVRSPGELNPNVQEALSSVPEFAALDAETQITVTQDVALVITRAATNTLVEEPTAN